MHKIVLSPEAVQSLADIDDYTAEQFGPLQAIRDLDTILDRLKYLAEDPKRGKQRDDLKKAFYSYFVGSHTIYYRISDDRLQVIDILHQSMEPERHLPE